MTVGDVMSREVVTVPPGASLKEAARLLVEYRISGVPVVDNQNHVVGVVSEADVLAKAEELAGCIEEPGRMEPAGGGECFLPAEKPGRKAGDAYGARASRPLPEHADETHDVPFPQVCECGGVVEEEDHMTLTLLAIWFLALERTRLEKKR